mgnify:CR=1 FL=1
MVFCEFPSPKYTYMYMYVRLGSSSAGVRQATVQRSLIYDTHRYDIYSWSDTSVFSSIIKKKHITHIIETNSVTYRDIYLIPADVRVAVLEDYSMTPGHQDIQ